MSKMFWKSVYLSFFGVAAAGCSYGYRIVVKRLLGLEAYGQIGIILAILNLISLLILSAIPPAIARYRAEGKGVLGASLNFGYIGMGIGALLLLLAPAFMAYYELPLGFVVIIAATVPVLTFAAAGRGILQGGRKTTLLGLTQLMEQGTRFLLAALLILGGYLIFGAVLAILLASALTAVFALFIVRKEKSGFGFRPVLEYMVPISATRIVDGVILNIDLLMLKFWAPLGVIGMYSIAGPVARIPLYVFTAIATVLLPEIARDKKNAGVLTKKAVLIGGLMLAGILVLLLFPVFFIDFLFSTEGMSHAELATTANTLRILAVSGFFIGIYKILTSALQGMGMAKKIVPLALGVLGLDVLLIFSLAPTYGMIGASMATLVSSVVATLGGLVILRKSSA